MNRGASPYGLRGTSLAIPNGSVANPSIRFGRERSGLYRAADGRLGLGVKRFATLELSQTEVAIRSNAPGAGVVTPLTLTRANATTANGQETTVDVREAAALVGRLAAYRQTATKYGWRLYGSSVGALSATADLAVDGDGNGTFRGGLTLGGPLAGPGTPLSIPGAVTIGGLLSLIGPGTGIAVGNNASIGGTLTLPGNGLTLSVLNSGSFGGNLTVGLTLTLPGAGTALSVTNNASIGGVLTLAGPGTALSVTNNASVGGLLSATRAAGTGLAVTANATIGGVLSLTGNALALSVTNSASFGGNVTVGLTLTLPGAGTALSVTNNVQVGGLVSLVGPGTALAITNNAAIAGVLSLIGPGTALAITNNATIGGTLVVGTSVNVIPSTGSATILARSSGGGTPLITLGDSTINHAAYWLMQTTATPAGLGTAVGDVSLYTVNGKMIVGVAGAGSLMIDTAGQGWFSAGASAAGTLTSGPPPGALAAVVASASGAAGNALVQLFNATSGRLGMLALQGGAANYGLGQGVGDLSLYSNNGRLILGAFNIPRLSIEPTGVVTIPGQLDVGGAPLRRQPKSASGGPVILTTATALVASFPKILDGLWLVLGSVTWLAGSGDEGALASTSIYTTGTASVGTEAAYWTIGAVGARDSSFVSALVTVTPGDGNIYLTATKAGGSVGDPSGSQAESFSFKAVYLGPWQLAGGPV